MTKTEQRKVAMGAVRSYLRQMQIDPRQRSAEDAAAALDDLSRSQPDTIAARWYSTTTEAQWSAFRREWNQYRKRGY